MRSLLVRYGLAMSSIMLIAFLVPLGLLARSLAEERALSAGRQDAQSVAMFAGSVTTDEAQLEGTLLAVNGGERATTAFLPDGRVLGAPAERTSAMQLAQLGTALTARTEGGAEVLLPVGGANGVTVVRTFIPDRELTEGVAQAWLLLAVVGVVLLAVTALAGDRIARQLSRSVRDLAQVADRLGSGDLSARVVPSGPAEVASVGTVLNGLGDRVADLLADERELVADLSHRLRTPITALQLDVDLLTEASERDRMAGHVGELVVAVDAIIHSARTHDRRAPERCDAGDVVRERSRFWTLLAADQGRQMTVVLPPGPAPVAVDREGLGAALDVLVDNVFKHTPAGCGFELSVGLTVDPEGGWVEVAVSDEGAGLADLGLTERGTSGTGSTGIGLDVARRTAERGGGQLVVSGRSDGPGARFALVFPEALTEP